MAAREAVSGTVAAAALLLLAFCVFVTPAAADAVIPWKIGLNPVNYNATIRIGHRVTWVWKDSLPHSVQGTSANALNLFLGAGTGTSIVTKLGFQYIHVFRTTGVFAYQCAVHGYTMFGYIKVLPPPPKGVKARTDALHGIY